MALGSDPARFDISAVDYIVDDGDGPGSRQVPIGAKSLCCNRAVICVARNNQLAWHCA